jgi:hypothetical protein
MQKPIELAIPREVDSSESELDALDEAYLDAIRRYVDAVVAPLREQHAQIEADARATIADFRVQVANLQAEIAHLKTANEMLRVDDRNRVDAELDRIREAMALVRDGRDGVDGEPGPPGPPGRDGRDGVGLAGVLIDRSDRLVITCSNGTVRELGVVVGKDGKDGITFEDFEISGEYDGERTATIKVTSKGKTLELPMKFPIPIYRGYWRENTQYETGDQVTHQGSIWRAKTDISERPPQFQNHLPVPDQPSNNAWQLICKRGRDGRDGKQGEKGEKGDPGRPGRDLTHLK